MILTTRFLVPFVVARIRNDRAASLVEYALLVALMAVACIATVTTLGKKLRSNFTSVASSI